MISLKWWLRFFVAFSDELSTISVSQLFLDRAPSKKFSTHLVWFFVMYLEKALNISWNAYNVCYLGFLGNDLAVSPVSKVYISVLNVFCTLYPHRWIPMQSVSRMLYGYWNVCGRHMRMFAWLWRRREVRLQWWVISIKPLKDTDTTQEIGLYDFKPFIQTGM